MKYDKEVLTINDILTSLDNFDNKEKIINAIKQSLYDIETDWHHEEYLKQQLATYKQKEEKIKEYCETIKEKYKFFHESNTTDVSAILEIIGGE